MKTITKKVFTFQELLELRKQKKISEKALERARHWLREAATEGEWYEYTYELWKSALAQIGFEDVEINFRGFCSQGDGASFTTKHVNMEVLLEFLLAGITPSEQIQALEGGKPGEEDFRPFIVHSVNGLPQVDPKCRRLLPLFEDGTAGIEIERTGHHYVHEHTCRASMFLNEPGDYATKPSGEIDWKQWISEKPKTRKLFNGLREDVEQFRLDLCRAIYHSLEEDYEAQTADEALVELCDANGWHFDLCGNRE